MNRLLKYMFIFFVVLLFTLPNLICGGKGSLSVKNILQALTLENGWQKTSEIRTFTAENLWEFIDGAAEQFILYGVKSTATTDVKNQDSKAEFSIELYQMPDPLNAFGVYSMERNADGSFPEVGTEGCWNGTSLFFYKNNYYAKIVGFEENKKLEQPVKYIAERLAAVIPGQLEKPSALALFPQDGLRKHSEKYYSKNVLAQSYLINGYTAEYTVGKANCLLFFVLCSDSIEANKSFTTYKTYIETDSKKPTTNVSIGDGGFEGDESFYKKILAFRRGSVAGGILGEFETDSGRKTLEQLITNIEKRK